MIWNIFLTNANNDLMQKIIVSSKIIAIISGIFSQITKVGRVFLMATVPMLPHAVLGRYDHREYALYFILHSTFSCIS